MKLQNVLRAKRRLSDLKVRYQRHIGDALLAAASDLNSRAIVDIQRNSGGGRTYRRGKRTHTASAPGEIPNADTGELVRGMFFRKAGNLTAMWGNRAAHARPLEFGTSKMAARPFMRPTYIALKGQISKRVADAIRRAVKEAASGR